MSTNVMSALLTESKPFPLVNHSKPFAEIFKFKRERLLALQQDIRRASQSLAEWIFQSDLAARIKPSDFHGELVLEVGFGAKNGSPVGHP